MSPDLPTPLTITCPSAAASRFTALAKLLVDARGERGERVALHPDHRAPALDELRGVHRSTSSFVSMRSAR